MKRRTMHYDAWFFFSSIILKNLRIVLGLLIKICRNKYADGKNGN